ncbi:MAG: tRNA pseudouridine(38-40) synthase TruA [Phycisphaerales bacterium]
MPRYKLTLAYDGTAFHGWQMQHPPAPGDVGASERADGDEGAAVEKPRLVLRTVQEEVQRAVREIVREPVLVQGASRTDAGVHARGQVAAFTCSGEAEPGGSVEATPRSHGGWPTARGVDRLVRAINGRLPEDVMVLGAEPVASDFQPISGAISKCYTYAIHSSPARPLFDRYFVQHIWERLDVAAMNEAARRLVGEHDFAAFAAAGHGRLTTVRTVHSCEVEVVDGCERGWGGTGAGWNRNDSGRGDGGLVSAPPGSERDFPARRVVIRVTGNGFLWNMVRIIAGTLVEVGRGVRSAESMEEILASRDRRRAGATLPPTGLCLEWIRYA